MHRILGRTIALTAATASLRHASTAPTKTAVWALWNEGNLFSLSVPELSAFLTEQGTTVDPKAKKSALVRQVEEMMAAEQATGATGGGGLDTVASVTSEVSQDYGTSGADLFDDADVYGDWGAEATFEDRKELDFMELSPSKLQENYEPLPPRAFQLLHDESSADVGLAVFDPSKLPGLKDVKEAFTPTAVRPEVSNKIRFRRGLKWCVTNLWNMNIPGEINIGAGKALYWRSIAKHNKTVLPIWTCQTHLYNTHPYTWYAVAPDSCKAAMEALAIKLQMTETQPQTTSYKLSIKRNREVFDCELNEQLATTALMRPWDRLLVGHLLRHTMPDIRFLVRARHPIKKRVAEAYFETQILASAKDTVRPVLAPDLGEVVYCCERRVRKWAKSLMTGVTLQLVETRRLPLIVTREGDEGERLEYEFIASLPQQTDRVDLHALSDELWDYGGVLAGALEEGMQDLQAFTMPSSAAFDAK